MSNKHKILTILLSASILLVACGIRRIRVEETTNASEIEASGQTTGSQESTAATEATPTPTSKPTPKPTSKPTPKPTSKPTSTPTPTPTPTPMPESVFFPRETYPDGQLFDEKYYAVLPGEGTIYYVYDCYGEIIHTFTQIGDWGPLPIGLFEKHEIEQFTRFSANKTESQSPVNRRHFPGGYYEWPFWESDPADNSEILRVVTDKGETIIIKNEDSEWPYAEWNMVTYPDFTRICVLERIWTGEYTELRLHYLKISSDGTVLQNFSLTDLPFAPVQILNDKYLIISENESNYEFGNLTDISGKILLENVTPIVKDIIGRLTQSGVLLSIGDYFIWNGRTFDADLKLVLDETRTPDGHLIPSVRYYVDGVLCQIEPRSYWYIPDRDTYAVGTDGSSKIAIKSIWGDCVIRDVDAGKVSVLDVSSSMVLLSDYSIYSLKTGEFLRNANIEGRSVEMEHRLTDRYLIVSYESTGSYQPQLCESFYIFDEYGNLRYYSNSSQAGPTKDDLILLKRGPYIGIADLNGDWVLKTVDPAVKRDAEEPSSGW